MVFRLSINHYTIRPLLSKRSLYNTENMNQKWAKSFQTYFPSTRMCFFILCREQKKISLTFFDFFLNHSFVFWTRDILENKINDRAKREVEKKKKKRHKRRFNLVAVRNIIIKNTPRAFTQGQGLSSTSFAFFRPNFFSSASWWEIWEMAGINSGPRVQSAVESFILEINS